MLMRIISPGRAGLRIPFLLLFLVLFSGCLPEYGAPLRLPAPLSQAPKDQEKNQAWVSRQTSPGHAGQQTKFLATPPPVVFARPAQAAPPAAKLKLAGPKVAVNFDGVALPAFINEVYGNILKLSFEIAPALRDKKDLVTLRTARPQTPAELDSLARQVLNHYGVAVERQGDLLRFVAAKSVVGEPPLLISGRTLPEVPLSHRPVFQLVPLTVVRNTNVAGWLKMAFKGQELQVFEAPERNAILLLGPAAIVRQAVAATKVLDQPNMRGKCSLRIEPVFLRAEELAKLLVKVLKNEGYSAALRAPLGSIIIMPVKPINSVFVFAADAAVLAHIKQWAINLDRQSVKKDQQTYFYYQVQNTSADDLGKLLRNIIHGTGRKEAAKKGQPPAAAFSSDNVVIDKIRNGIIFNGSAAQWQKIHALIQEMDRPAREVLIEVTVAEITLTNQQKLGVEWLLKGLGIDHLGGSLRTLGGLGLGAGNTGILYTLDSAGQTRALLNALASKNRVSILSTPRVMVKSGMEATIDVGSEVPIVTSQSTSSDLQTKGNSAILQEIQYRKTGVLLKVKPVVHSGNRVDLNLTQEVSDASPNETSTISSPSIFSRRVSTSLSLADGGSVLLGGLISTHTSHGSSSVPVLGDIPFLGRLFRVDSTNKTRTELMVLIVPYVIDNHQEAAAVTEAFRQRLHIFDGRGQ